MVVVVPPFAQRENGHRQVFCRADSPATTYSSDPVLVLTVLQYFDWSKTNEQRTE